MSFPANVIPVFGSQRAYADLNFSGGSFGLDGRIVNDLTALPGFTFTRASLAMGYDATGKLTYGPNNLLTYSQDFDNAAWAAVSTKNVTANTDTAPDGTQTADTLTDNSAAAFQGIIGSVTVPNDTMTRVFSIYVKKTTGGTAPIFGINAQYQGGTAVVTNFRLNTDTGAVNSTLGGFGAQSVGNYWRAYISLTNNGLGNTSFQASMYPAAGVGPALSPDSATATGSAVIWGAQLEAVTYQTTPSTYYPTTTAAYYGPRLVYDPVTLASLGILVEEARTNLLLQSQTFDNASWFKGDATVTGNSTTSPDGTTNADTMLANAGTGTTPRLTDTATATVNATVYTASIYAKAGTYSFVQIYIASQSPEWANFTLSGAGTASANGSSTASITALSNGWYRLTMTYTAGGVDRRPLFSLAASGSATRAQTWNPAGTESVIFWQAQLEAGTGASSPIPTTTASVTRAADAVSITGLSVPNPHSMAAEWTPGFDNGSNFRRTGTLTNSGGTPEDTIYQRHTNNDVRANVTAVADVTLGTGNTITSNKAAARFETNNTTGSLNGAATIAPDTSVTLPTGIDRLFIGQRSGTLDHLNGTISRIRIYNRALSDAQLQSLTS